MAGIFTLIEFAIPKSALDLSLYFSLFFYHLSQIICFLQSRTSFSEIGWLIATSLSWLSKALNLSEFTQS